MKSLTQIQAKHVSGGNDSNWFDDLVDFYMSYKYTTETIENLTDDSKSFSDMLTDQLWIDFLYNNG